RSSELFSRAEGCWTFDARDRMLRLSRPTAHHHVDDAPTTTGAPLPRERVRSSALPRRWLIRPEGPESTHCGNSTSTTLLSQTRVRVNPHPCTSARAGRARSREGPSGAQRCCHRGRPTPATGRGAEGSAETRQRVTAAVGWPKSDAS